MAFIPFYFDFSQTDQQHFALQTPMGRPLSLSTKESHLSLASRREGIDFANILRIAFFAGMCFA